VIAILGIALSLPIQNTTDFSLTQAPKALYAPTWDLAGVSLRNEKALEERLFTIHQLEDGWHGLGSIRVTQSVLDRVRQASSFIAMTKKLPAPEVTPNSNGTISLEWENDLMSIYLEIGRTRINGFLQSKAGEITVIPDTSELHIGFFKELSEIFSPSVGETFTNAISRTNEILIAA
jgi:hypothetical protein